MTACPGVPNARWAFRAERSQPAIKVGTNCFVTSRRDAQKIDERDLVFEGLSQPAVVGGVGISPHEGIVDRLVLLENLLVGHPLVVVPDPRAETWERRS